MQRKTIEHWKPGAFERVRVTDAALGRMIHLGRTIRPATEAPGQEQRERLRDELEQAVMILLEERHSAGHPGPSNVRDRFRAIADKARALRETLGDSGAEGTPELPFLIRSGLWKTVVDKLPAGEGRTDQAREELDTAVLGIRQIEAWAGEAASKAEKAVGAGGHQRDQALDRLFFDLGLIYEQAFHRPPGATTGGPSTSARGQVDGPFIRFVRCVLQVAAVHLRVGGEVKNAAALWAIPPRAIRERWRRISKHYTDLDARILNAAGPEIQSTNRPQK